MLSRFAAALAAGATLALPRPADAFRPVPGAAEQRPMTAEGLPLRTHREITWDRVPGAARAAWEGFREAHQGDWRASWDVATGVPSRILGAGIPAPGSVESPGAAERAARAFLSRHIDLLAPGSDPDDFVVVANRRDGDLRSVGLEQYHDGLRVVGGQVSFRFRNDRLFVAASEALPHVRIDGPDRSLPAAAARRAAADATRARSPAAGDVLVGDVQGPLILPLVGRTGIHGYRYAMRVDVGGGAPGQRWDVYVDADNGQFLARERSALPTTATIHFDTPVRRPGGERGTYPAQRARVEVNGRTAETSDTGILVWFGDSESADVTLRPEGTFVELSNVAGSLAELATTVSSGSSFIWESSDDEVSDAQLTAFVHTQVAADRARAIVTDPDWLGDEVVVNVNIDSACNAFFDQHSKSINFFRSSEECENTARLPDVIYHEFGHLLHVQSLIPGVGQFDGAFSEGASDYFAASITDDPAVGRGFFRTSEPLRDIDPDDNLPTWPDDISDVHSTGLIISGAMWKLRRELIAEHGRREGVAIADELFEAAMQRATDIPSSYIEILAQDDDDGDLTTGTPNICAINRAFGAHGLRAVRSEIEELGAEPVSEDGHPVGFRVYGIYDQCDSDRIDTAEVVWRRRGESEEFREPMEESAGGFAGAIPEQPRNSAIKYRFEITFENGGTLRLPQNPADPELDLYVGEVIPLYCTSFEENPFQEGWTRGATRGSNDWAWGAPAGAGGDPPFAYAGDSVIGNALGGDGSTGLYPTDSINYVRSPLVEVGDFTNVRLQYRRWLRVEDGFFDRAAVIVNGYRLWENANSDQGVASRVHHADQMWRFHDVPLTPVLGSDSVQVGFELETDGGLELGGWNVDELCVVADPDSVCGDGVVTGFEHCDDGDDNDDGEPDACRTSCVAAFCGDGVVDGNEECDPAADEDVLCTDSCTIAPESGSCHCRAGTSGGSFIGPLLVALLGGVMMRRRRRATA